MSSQFNRLEDGQLSVIFFLSLSLLCPLCVTPSFPCHNVTDCAANKEVAFLAAVIRLISYSTSVYSGEDYISTGGGVQRMVPPML